MNKTHRAEIAKDAKRYLDDMFGSPFFVSWFESGFAGHEAISTGTDEPG
jgi:hypothetical protein